MRRARSAFMVLLICVLAVPTCAVLLGILPSFDWTPEALPGLEPWLRAGALLGLANVLLRPILRVLGAPIGCLTLGLSGFAVDVGMLYLCAYLLEGFAVPSLGFAVATAALVNTICAVVGAR